MPTRAALVDRTRLAWSRLRRLPPQLYLVLPAALLIYVLALLPFTPSPAELRKAKAEQSSVLLAADGSKLAEYKRFNREWVALDDLPEHLVNALLATEDHRFHDHFGLDFRRIAGAAWSTVRGDLQGGSTITQQLARNLYPQEIGRAPSLTRKVKEALTALKIEANYSKPEILETYLNTVPFLYNAVGIEMAARTYFGKSAKRLSVVESATLVGMLKGTAYYNPVLHPERSRERRNLVLAQMAKHGHLRESSLKSLQRQPLRVSFTPQRQAAGPAPHLAAQVRRWLADRGGRKGYDLYADGLVVHTGIHAPLQEAANRAVERQMDRLRTPAAQRSRKEPLQAGFVAVDPRSGEVRAWVGSADFAQDQFDHVAQARRQPGSTFKPFVYGAAFARGMRPDDTLVDTPVTIGRGRDQWSPGDPAPPSGKPVSLADGLAYSRNRITAQLVEKVRPRRVADLARDMGVRKSKLHEVPSLALGTSPVTLQEMVAGYATIANGGRYLAPRVVTRVEDRKGRVLESFGPPRPHQALREDASLMLVDALRGVVDRGTARAIRSDYGIRADVAGKTGTTQGNADGWFILMHPQLVAGAWVGFNDAAVTMGDQWGEGARSALPIVATVFQQALRRDWIDDKASFGRLPEPQDWASGLWARLVGLAAPPEEAASGWWARLVALATPPEEVTSGWWGRMVALLERPHPQPEVAQKPVQKPAPAPAAPPPPMLGEPEPAPVLVLPPLPEPPQRDSMDEPLVIVIPPPLASTPEPFGFDPRERIDPEIRVLPLPDGLWNHEEPLREGGGGEQRWAWEFAEEEREREREAAERREEPRESGRAREREGEERSRWHEQRADSRARDSERWAKEREKAEKRGEKQAEKEWKRRDKERSLGRGHL